MKILVTGAAGFIGSHFVQYILNNYDDTLWSLDALTYAGNLKNLDKVMQHSRHKFIHGNILNRQLVEELMANVDAVVNFAAETHVDRSINDSTDFVQSNIVGTSILLDIARLVKLKRFIQISTDEVYGSLGSTGKFTENSPLSPNSPYSASKASADLLAEAAFHTFHQPIIITRCSNNYGPNQNSEKFIPTMIISALNDKKLPLYGDGLHVRDWIHVADHVRGIDTVLRRGKDGEIYNMGGTVERNNLEIAQLILKLLNKPASLIHHVEDRRGHDRRYAIDFSKINKELAWSTQIEFSKGLKDTIEWYQNTRIM